MAYTIFIVEDDPGIRTSLAQLLERYGYRCLSTQCFDDVPEQVLASGAQLVLLDLNLPRYDGYHICRSLRQQSSLPIIVVTSRATRMDELMSMNLGADDFVTKPYDTQILLARIGRLLERTYPGAVPSALEARGLTLDLGRSTARYGTQEVELTRNEVRILALLLRSPDQIVSRCALINELWQSEAFVDDNTLTVNVNRLRRKLERLGAKGFIATHRGQGYRL